MSAQIDHKRTEESSQFRLRMRRRAEGVEQSAKIHRRQIDGAIMKRAIQAPFCKIYIYVVIPVQTHGPG